MTVHQPRRAVLAFATVVVASVTIGAPVSLAACPLHAPITRRAVLSVAQVHRTSKAIALPSPTAHFEDHVADPFATMHFE
jgi:hypothetical protein